MRHGKDSKKRSNGQVDPSVMPEQDAVTKLFQSKLCSVESRGGYFPTGKIRPGYSSCVKDFYPVEAAAKKPRVDSDGAPDSYQKLLVNFCSISWLPWPFSLRFMQI